MSMKVEVKDIIGRAYWLDDLPPCYNAEKLMEYLDQGGDPNAGYDEKSCLIHWVACYGTTEQLDAAIAAGGDVNCRSPWKWTPLFYLYDNYALEYKIDEVFEARVLALLERGADVNAANQDGVTPLHKLAGSCRPRPNEVAFLVNHGAVVDATNQKGRQPIHNAAEMCQPMTVAKLVELGADINAKDNKGMTPLHLVGDGIIAWGWNEDQLLRAVNGLRDLGAKPSRAIRAHYRRNFDGMDSLIQALRTRCR